MYVPLYEHTLQNGGYMILSVKKDRCTSRNIGDITDTVVNLLCVNTLFDYLLEETLIL